MSNQDKDPQRRPAPRPMESATAAISSTELLAGGKELRISHGGEEYRLRLTASNKLILTK